MGEERIFEDSIMSGILQAMGCRVTPQLNVMGRTEFLVTGDVEGCLARLYGNEPVPVLSVLQNIKSCRHAIFNQKGKGDRNGKNYSR
ncbi:MAG: hypothetical protein NTU69_08005 [Proteobacteria bacterium]|nr:hypothetical protein [Pseudomonadota bacterium]